MGKNVVQNICELQNTTPVVGNPTVANPFGMVLVQRQFATTNPTAIQFVSLSQYPYTNYRLVITDFFFVSGTPNLLLQISTDNGNTFISTSSYVSYSYQLIYAATSFTNGGTPSTGLVLTTPNTALNSQCCDHMIWNLNSSTQYLSTLGTGTSCGGTTPYFAFYASTCTTSVAVNAFQLTGTSVIAFGGTFSLYGFN